MFLFEDGVSVEDFFCYHFYERPRKERKKFVTLYRSGKINKLLNADCKREIVEDKAKFGQYYSDFMLRSQRTSIDLKYEEFVAFYNEQGRLFAKPSFGCNGDGAFIIGEGLTESELKSAYEKIKSEPYVLETVLTQDGILKELNPHTLNTCRVNVFNNHGDMCIINAILRTGQGEVVTDNICAGGCVSEIEVETGKFLTQFVDLSNHSYEVHPRTGVSLLGKHMPCWEEIKKTAFEATKKLPGVVYASWDIAVIAGNRVAVVEGNTWGNFNIQQVPRQIGLRDRYDGLIREWKQKEN